MLAFKITQSNSEGHVNFLFFNLQILCDKNLTLLAHLFFFMERLLRKDESRYKNAWSQTCETFLIVYPTIMIYVLQIISSNISNCDRSKAFLINEQKRMNRNT